MKIPLNMGDDAKRSPQARDLRKLSGIIKAIQEGQWDAGDKLVREMKSYLENLAHKRAHGDEDAYARYLTAAEEGLLKAAKKFDTSDSIDKFKVYALDYIDKSMDKAGGSSGGFLGKLFGK